MTNDNSTMVLNHLVAALNIPITRQTISDDLDKHPDFDTLLAISEVLDNWQIPNASYNINLDALQAEITSPFVAVMSGNQFLMVSYLDNDQVIVSNEHWNKHRLDINQFKEQYLGTVLIAEKDQDSGESDYIAKRRKEIVNKLRLPIVISGGAILLVTYLFLHSAYFSTFNWQIAFITLTKSAGLAVAILLIVQSIDSNNPLIQKLCGGDNDKNCNAILSSNAAKITDELSWSEVGLFYFSGTLLVLLFNSNSSSIISMLVVFNIASLPYTFYSIYHQWKVAKQWCKLCLSVQALLWLEFLSLSPLIFNGFKTPTLSEFLNIIPCLVIPILGWILLKPYLLLSKQLEPLKSQLRQYKFNKNLFNHFLDEEDKYELPKAENTIMIGNPEAEKIITIVSNPYCKPCAKAHKELEWINGRDDVKLQVVFTTDSEKSAKVASHLLSIQENQNDLSLKKAIEGWYGQKQKNYESWAKLYPEDNSSISNNKLNRQREWCELAKIDSTPVVFLNGRRIPKNYRPEDIKYFI